MPIEAAVLVWARESIGLDPRGAAKRISVSEATLAKWEDGTLYPTVKQLRRAANAYKRPVSVLLLSEVPTDFTPLRDYRRPPDAPEKSSPQLLAEVRRAQIQRQVVLELAELLPEVEDGPEVPSARLVEPPEAPALRLRDALGVSHRQQWRFRSADEALRVWIQAVESLGVLVMQTDRVDRSEVKGFSIGERPRPLVALNGSDWPRQRVFTLMHELVHVALRMGGICDMREADAEEDRTPNEVIEHFCNAVAAAILMPGVMVMRDRKVVTANPDTEWDLEELMRLAGAFEVSTESYLLRLVSLHKASWSTYWELKPEIDAAYQAADEARRQRQAAEPGPPIYYQVKARNLGREYVREVLEAYGSRVISPVDVADFLDIKYNQLGKLGEAVGL